MASKFMDDPFFTSADFCWMIVKPDYYLDVRNQMNTVCCYAFVATNTMYANQCLEHKEKPREASVQELLDSLHSYYPPKNPPKCFKDKGVVPKEGLPNTYTNAFRYIKFFGLHSAELYPFVGEVQTQTPKLDPHDKMGIGSFERIRDRQLIKKHLILHPLTCAVLHVPSFRMWGYHDSVYEGLLPSELECIKVKGENYHALTIVGYGGRDGVDDYYICQNSYGPRWGHDGYIKLRRHLVRWVYFLQDTRTRCVQKN